MNELIEHGMYTPMSLSQLNLTSSSTTRNSTTTTSSSSSNNQGVDLDRLGVASVYDRKKFAQLKQFVRNVVATVQRSRSSASVKQQQQQPQPQSSSVDQQISNGSGTQTGSRAVSSSSANHPDEMIMKSLMNARAAATTSNNNPTTNGLASTDRKPQLFKKNPNLANTGIVTARNTGVAKKIVKATASNSSAHTNGAGQSTINSRASTGITTISQQKAQLLRAKSSEPLDIKKKLFSIAPSKSTVSIGLFYFCSSIFFLKKMYLKFIFVYLKGAGNSVNHPKPASDPSRSTTTTTNGSSSSKFFGPKLSNSNDANRLVRKVDMNTYDYGVPQQAASTGRSSGSTAAVNSGRLLDKKQQKYLEKFGRNLYHSKSIGDVNNHSNYNTALNKPSQSQRVTSDIFVFARKRPKLECESNFDDMISVVEQQQSTSRNRNEEDLSDQGGHEYANVINHDDFQRRAAAQPTTTTGSICVNECKSTVDGTAILRKVFDNFFTINSCFFFFLNLINIISFKKNDFTFDKTFDSSLTNESIFKSSILPFISLESNDNR